MSDQLSRRGALKLVLASASLAGVACSAGPSSFGDVAAGTVTSTPVGTLRAVSGAPAILGRDANGVYAMTSTCTHQSCDLSSGVTASGVFCSCHGSSFDTNGNVTRGPASSPLEHFAVTADASGNLTIHGGQTVDSGTRLKV